MHPITSEGRSIGPMIIALLVNSHRLGPIRIPLLIFPKTLGTISNSHDIILNQVSRAVETLRLSKQVMASDVRLKILTRLRSTRIITRNQSSKSDTDRIQTLKDSRKTKTPYYQASKGEQDKLTKELNDSSEQTSNSANMSEPGWILLITRAQQWAQHINFKTSSTDNSFKWTNNNSIEMISALTLELVMILNKWLKRSTIKLMLKKCSLGA